MFMDYCPTFLVNNIVSTIVLFIKGWFMKSIQNLECEFYLVTFLLVIIEVWLAYIYFDSFSLNIKMFTFDINIYVPMWINKP